MQPPNVPNDSQRALTAFNDQYARDVVGADLDVGVAIHTGAVVVGSIGSPDKLGYNVIGEPVHRLAEIEAETKQYSNSIVISEEVLSGLGDGFDLEPLRATGGESTSDPARLYRLIGKKGAR